jgi:hypothetical protein
MKMTRTVETTELNISDKQAEEEHSVDETPFTETKTDELTEWELEMVASVFKSLETGVSEGTILSKVRFILTNLRLRLALFIYPPTHNLCNHQPSPHSLYNPYYSLHYAIIISRWRCTHRRQK